MQSKQRYLVMSFVLTVLFYHISVQLLGTSNAILAGAGVSVSTSYDVWIIFFGFLSGITFTYCMLLFIGIPRSLLRLGTADWKCNNKSRSHEIPHSLLWGASFGAWITEQKEKLIGSAKKILS